MSDVKDDLRDRAVRLFEFLGQAQRLREKPVYSVDKYQEVVWWSSLPDHATVRRADHDSPAEPGSAFLTIGRMPRSTPPEPDPLLLPWLEPDRTDPFKSPILANTAGNQAQDPEQPPSVASDEDLGPLVEPFRDWLQDWEEWAEEERSNHAVREVYKRAFSLSTAASGNPETLELVLGVCCLAWTPPDHPSVKRHLLTVPVTVALDDQSGDLQVLPSDSPDGVRIELDMLDPALVRSPHIGPIKESARAFEGNPLDREAVGALARRLLHSLDAEGHYDNSLATPDSTPRAAGAFAPALILRRRTQRGLKRRAGRRGDPPAASRGAAWPRN